VGVKGLLLIARECSVGSYSVEWSPSPRDASVQDKYQLGICPTSANSCFPNFAYCLPERGDQFCRKSRRSLSLLLQYFTSLYALLYSSWQATYRSNIYVLVRNCI